jgi:hypothetical protein
MVEYQKVVVDLNHYPPECGSLLPLLTRSCRGRRKTRPTFSIRNTQEIGGILRYTLYPLRYVIFR